MLNRRHLRVKVLQSLYAFHQSDTRDIKAHEKNLLSSIDQVFEMYIWMLSLISEVIDYSETDATERANKHLPTADDLNASIKIMSNRFLVSLKDNRDYLIALKKYKVEWSFDPELAKSLFTTLKNSTEYAEYIAKTDDTLQTDKDIIKFIFKKVILKSSLAEQVFEDKFIYWPVDREVLQALIAKTFKNFSSDNYAENKLADISGNWVEDREFVVNLFEQSIRHDVAYQELIAQKTLNWEPDRIAMMDTLLMKMAIAEFINFTSIPVKVTINEYLEISKEFSTPKSNSFINGILDKILFELKEQNKIKKIGRGLIE
ncbi:MULTISPECIES: transcription antitermination protein NusB [unclassified Mucilaginibacter]|uniref:transcription antitermination protein NusB n=1 Tax=unclassified Mucilaginibacter TaxID=2617802 RepID=UPI002AC94E11|nr:MULTISPECIES: transcription antitermination protein NusB [unclassified Mucilaginibacter]MEB0263660.1 transcription antitermination protein NusB [Mucilaginibacter sp. 10I4]MEB0277894.1 transcription antitermination protein NusB [Mucilaginibacter sp. 10B2]MEB0300559.1 transcription antitermination protein NusB [Mucilaginibacter sp. 5C4]WPX22785.1 transcription antitermination protein NusB [Mucilaginibacter sp. 5C4]